MLQIKHRPLIVLAFIAIVCFYGWTALSPKSQNAYWFERAPTGYEELADAFLHGQLSMIELPKPELLALPDPYDPVANDGLRHHDWILYEGKYFLQQSPLPALLLYVPAGLLGFTMNGSLACILLGSALLILLFRLLSRTVSNLSAASPTRKTLLVLLLGFGSYTPILLRRPAAYEVAILMGSTFAALSMLLYTRFQSAERKKYFWASMATLASLFSFWSRPAFLFVPILIILFLLLSSRNDLGKIVLSIVVPLFAVATAMGSYNYFRFRSVSEFGNKFQLAGFKPEKFSTKWVIPKLQSDFLAHRFFGSFPWTTTGDSPFNAKMRPGYIIEQNLGILIVMPWAVIICLAFWQNRQSFISQLRSSAHVLIIAVLTAVGTWIVQLLVVPGTTSRYLGDFAPFLVLVLLSVLLSWDKLDFSLKLNFGHTSVAAIIILIFLNQLASITALALLLAFFCLRFHAIKLEININLFLVFATIWTVGIIGLTSLTVQGFDQLNLLPPGFNWWER